MSRSFKDAKKSRMGFSDLATKMEQSKKSGNYGDDNPNMWYPELDKAKNGYAVIRFLPEKETDLPWVKTYSHGFQVNGKWYIEECPTTKDEKCPVCENNSEYWNDGTEAGKDIARDRKRRQSWFSNVLIVDDPKTPENNGRVVIFKYGFKIYTKIKDKLTPPEAFADETPVNVFDMWDGANFKLKIRKVDGQVNYDASSFEDCSQIAATDKEMEAMWEQIHDLNQFTAEDKYKPYVDLEKRFNQITKGSNGPAKSAAEQANDDAGNESAPEEKSAVSKETADTKEAGSSEADDTMSFFEDLAEKDT